jgi:hypothetical protein
VQACELTLYKTILTEFMLRVSLSCWRKEQPFRSGLISAPLKAHRRYLQPNGILFLSNVTEIYVTSYINPIIDISLKSLSVTDGFLILNNV